MEWHWLPQWWWFPPPAAEVHQGQPVGLHLACCHLCWVLLPGLLVGWLLAGLGQPPGLAGLWWQAPAHHPFSQAAQLLQAAVVESAGAGGQHLLFAAQLKLPLALAVLTPVVA